MVARWGGMRGCSGGVYMVAQGVVHGCSGGAACMVAPGGVCVVFSVFSDTMRYGQ